jgi:hypothetical protein
VALLAAFSALAGAPPEAQAAKPVAKFKLLSMSGSAKVTFSEQEIDEDGGACVGTTDWSLSYRSTKPVKFYVFQKSIGREPAIVLSSEPKSGKFTVVPAEGEATVTSQRDYTATDGCNRDPDLDALCPATPTSSRAEVYLAGSFGDPAGSIRAGVSDVATFDAFCTTNPVPLNWGEIEFETGAFPVAVSRKQILGGKKRVKDSGSDEVPLVDTADGPFEDATATGVSRGEISVSLKRLKLKPSSK